MRARIREQEETTILGFLMVSILTLKIKWNCFHTKTY